MSKSRYSKTKAAGEAVASLSSALVLSSSACRLFKCSNVSVSNCPGPHFIPTSLRICRELLSGS